MPQETLRIVAAWTAFALVHSLTVSGPFQRWFRNRIGDARFEAWHRLGYTALSVATFALLASYLRSLPDDRPFFSAGPPWRWLLRLGQLAGLLFLLRTPLRIPEFLGLRQAMERSRPRGPARSGDPPTLFTGGTYAIVRHPLYLGCIAIVACQPDQTVVSATSSVMAILYFCVGTFHEEARLLDRFGDEYREYRRRVPRLLPLHGRSHSRPGGEPE